MADTWTPISGYTPQDYTDTMVFEMSSETKNVEKILGQVLIAGEENSQYIKFVLSRYWDGIDISGKTFSIEYALAGKYYGTSEAVNAEMSTDQIRFGWVVPAEACCVSGTLFFILKVESEGYVLKSRIVEEPVYKTIDVGDVVPEPTKEQWYREFEARVEGAIDDAEAAIEATQAAQASAEAAAQNAQASENNAEAAAAEAQIRYGSPLTASEAALMVEENRVYVYTGSESGYTFGNWYYYDGSAWVSGGVYNGTGVNTDTTLTQAGMAADAKAVGDELSTIKEDLSEYEGIFTADVDESVKNWLDEHPEATTTVEDGSITTSKLADGSVTKEKLSEEFKSAETTNANARKKLVHIDVSGAGGLSSSTEYSSFQGVCFDTANNHWFLTISKRDYSDTMIVELDQTYQVIRSVSVGGMGHGNDLTYNSKTDKIYCVNDDAYTITEIDPNTLTVTSTIQTGDYSNWTIAYDPNKDCYYVSDNLRIRTYDASWELVTITSADWDIRGDYYGTYANIIPQGMFVFDDKLVAVYNTVGDSEQSNFVSTVLKVLDVENEQTTDVMTWNTEDSSDEAEGGDVVDGVMYLFSGSRYIRVFTVYTDTTTYNDPDTDLFRSGRKLKNVSLDSIYMSGKYSCQSAAVANTITGKPSTFTDMGFSLLVIAQAHDFVEQILIDNNDNIYTRMFDGTSWKTWEYRTAMEVATDGVWTILKFKPLKAFLAFCNTTPTGHTYTADGSVYYSDSISIPMAFASRVVTYTLTGNAGGRGWVVNAAKTSSGVSYRLMRSASTGTDLQVQLIMAGLYN